MTVHQTDPLEARLKQGGRQHPGERLAAAAMGRGAPDPIEQAIHQRVVGYTAVVPVVWTASGENKLRLVAG